MPRPLPAILVLAVAAVTAACGSTPSLTTVPGSSNTGASTPGIETPASSTGARASIDPVVYQRPSRTELIAQAVAEGRLDQVTALDYRVRAMFGLPGLPDEFTAGVPREDSAALAQIAAMIDTLSAADQARLRPYLLRPTQAGSAWSAMTRRVASVGEATLGEPVAANAAATCTTWANSGDLDQRFKVWACADGDPQAAEIDIATVVILVQGIWDKMSTDMGGPPKPDAYGPNVPAEYGGDARIDFYALHMGQIVYRDGPNEIPAGAAAATQPAPPYTNADGSPRNASSGYLLLNVDTLEMDETSFTLDLIHEFFHLLQDAHNFRATSDGSREHWFVEASATWAETYYLRAASDAPHTWFYTFQADRESLQADDHDHQYASYVWPFFMEQDNSAQAVFDAWKATDSIAAHDFAAVTAAVGAQVSFDSRFHEFAVQNVNLNDVLRPANVRRYDELDANFYDDVAPFALIPAPVSPGSPFTSSESIPDLAAHYFTPEFSQNARKITISTSGLSPAGEVDGDFLAHYTNGSWKRIPVPGVLQFCRDDEGWDIDRGVLVVSNHGVQGAVSGPLEIDAKDKCQGDVRLRATFTGHQDDPLSVSDATFDLIVVWHRPNDLHDRLNFQFESGTFTFSTQVDGVCGGNLNDGGPLRIVSEDSQFLAHGDIQDRGKEAQAGLIDNRLNQGGLQFAVTAKFDIPSSAAECAPPYQFYGYVATCALEFKLATLDTLEPNATCEEGGTTWSGHIVEI